MFPELGYFALILATTLMCCNTGYLLYEKHWQGNRTNLKKVLPIYELSTVAITVAFVILFFAFMTNDFSVKYVWANGSRVLPTLYKLSNIWGGHEGSWLLWMAISMYYSKSLLHKINGHGVEEKFDVIGLSAMLALYGIYALVASNPFVRIMPIAPADGMDLNPLLQDPGFIIHPPCLYMGECGLLVTFILAWNLLMTKNEYFESKIYQWLTVWGLWSWGWLTIGITIGSWWAYRELGWGGFWFWDPVENAALMPWLCVTALTHAVKIKSNSKKAWVCVTGLSAFVLSLFGSFITRSGILVSVHSFATDRLHGILLLLMCVLACWPMKKVLESSIHKSKLKIVENKSREAYLIIQNKIMLGICFVVWFGTMYPVLIEYVFNNKISVGAGYFQTALMPMFLVLLWFLDQSSTRKRSKGKNAIMIAGSVIITLIANWFFCAKVREIEVQSILFVGYISYVLLGQILSKMRKQWNKNMHILSHCIWLLMAISIYINQTYGVEKIIELEKGKVVNTGDIEIQLEKVNEIQTTQGLTEQLLIKLKTRESEHILSPEIRQYVTRQIVKTKAAIGSQLMYDVYVVMSKNSASAYTARVYIKPLQSVFWFSGIMLGAIGLAISFAPNERSRKEIQIKKEVGK
ncbi:MAG: cytochrome c-type biogenesis CcmF C-terminal domain-containing protein [Pseudomonadota bacterium]|nr:cytochrome c-type biogenesis CcmF C-terminal domain-containing protein [Pseudomonadota bacterium]